MPVLLLASGDIDAKNKLRKAIEARYGHRPVMIDTLTINYRGKMRTRIGPVTTAAPFEACSYYRFPDAVRSDFHIKPLGVKIQEQIDCYDGEIYRQKRAGKLAQSSNQTQIHTLRARMWAVAVSLLTPLGENYVHLENIDQRSFRAINTQNNITAVVSLRGDYSIEQVSVDCVNMDSGKLQTLRIRFSEECIVSDEYAFPARFQTFWDAEPFYEAEMLQLQINSEIPTAIFRSEGPAPA